MIVSRVSLPQPVLICSACWKIQPPEDEVLFDIHEWVEATTFMTRATVGTRHYVLVDGYCHECLSELVAQACSATMEPPHLNA